MNDTTCKHGCNSSSKRQHLNSFYQKQDNKPTIHFTDKTTQQHQTRDNILTILPYYCLWRTLVYFITRIFLDTVLSLLIGLTRLYYVFNNTSSNRTFLQSISFFIGLVLLGNTARCQEGFQQNTKLMDATTLVGMHFVYKLPHNIFKCNFNRLEVSEGSTRSLPNWLAYSEEKQELYGVASLKDIGTFEILAVALTNSSTGTGRICSIRAFSINVLASESSSEVRTPLSSIAFETSSQTDHSLFQCSPGSQIILATVLFSADLHQMTGHERTDVLTSVADHLNAPSRNVALFTADKGHPLLSQLEQLSVLNSGAGDAMFKSGSKSLLTWLLSCGALKLGNTYISELESKAKDGTLSRILRYPIIGWHVTTGVQRSRHRARRAAANTPTPIATSILPTRVLSSSTIIINETSSLSRSSFVVSTNSTIVPHSSVYSFPSSSVTISSSQNTQSISSMEYVSTSTVSNMSDVLSSMSSTIANLTIHVNSTVPLPSLSSTVESSYSSMNETSYPPVTKTSTRYMNDSATISTLPNSTLLSFSSSTADISTSTYSSIYSKPSPSISPTENLTSIFSSSVLTSIVSITPNATSYLPSSIENSSLHIPSVFFNETVSLSLNSTASEVVSSTSSMNMTSSIQPSFRTSSPVFSSSTLSSSVTKNVTSYLSSIALSSSVGFPDSSSIISATSVDMVSTLITSNTSSSVTLLPSISTVPVVTTVNMSSMISPTVMNTSLIDGMSTIMLSSSQIASSSAAMFRSSSLINTSSMDLTSTAVLETAYTAVTSSSVSMVTAPSLFTSPVSVTSLDISLPYTSSSRVETILTSLIDSSSTMVLETYSSKMFSTVFPSSSSQPTVKETSLPSTIVETPFTSPVATFSSLGLTSSSVGYLSLSSITILSSVAPSMQSSAASTLTILSSLTSPSSSVGDTSLARNTITVLPSFTSETTSSSFRTLTMNTTNTTSMVTSPYSSNASKLISHDTSSVFTPASLEISSITSTQYTQSRTSNSSTITLFPTSVISTLMTTSFRESSVQLATSFITRRFSSLSSDFMVTSLLTPSLSNSTVVVPSSTALTSTPLNSTVSFSTSATLPSSPIISSSVVVPTTQPNSRPELKNDIGRIQTTAGVMFSYSIPEDTFHDSEDGNTRQLVLTMKQVVEDTAKDIPADFWLNFDSSKQLIEGLPMEKDIPDPSNPETGVKFLLTAKDHQGEVAYDVFEILIGSSPSVQYSQSLSVTLENDFEAFQSNLTQRLDLLGKISGYYKDPDTSQIRVISYKKGSVVVTWTNQSLPTNECNKEKLNDIAEKVVNDNGATKEFKEHLSPQYIVTGAQRTFSGVCIENMTTSAPLISARNVATESSDLWEKYVIPGIIVVIILLILAILLICFIRRRRAKPSDHERRTYTKRKPIILDPEIEMKPVPSKPLILENDSPLSHPPSYMSEPSLYRSPYGYYDNSSGDFDEEDYTPLKQSPVYETPPPSYIHPEEPEEPPPPPYMLPPALMYPRYELPVWEETSDV